MLLGLCAIIVLRLHDEPLRAYALHRICRWRRRTCNCPAADMVAFSSTVGPFACASVPKTEVCEPRLDARDGSHGTKAVLVSVSTYHRRRLHARCTCCPLQA
jgi:hypothetical protein